MLQLPEGMGPATARRLMATIGWGLPSRSRRRPPIGRDARHWSSFLTIRGGAARRGRRAAGAALGRCAGCADEDLLHPAAQLERLRTFLDPIVARSYDASAARLRDLDQLTLLAQGYEHRGRFLSELTLDPPSSTGDLAGPPLLDEDYLVLSTIHSAKGLEWDVVHVIHAADGMIPSRHGHRRRRRDRGGTAPALRRA